MQKVSEYLGYGRINSSLKEFFHRFLDHIPWRASDLWPHQSKYPRYNPNIFLYHLKGKYYRARNGPKN